MKKFLSVLLCICILISVPTVSAFAKDWNVKTEDIHPELQFIGNAVRTIMPHFTEKFFSVANFFLDNFGEGLKLSRKINYEEKQIERPDGSLLRICVYSPKEKAENVPGVLWIHGGGYAIGIPEQDISFIESFVLSSGCVVVAPDYTNSTDAPYPAAFDDCYLSLLWLKENGSLYGMRSDQIFVGGDSAGGGLCAAVTLKARDTKDVNIAFQMPLYPMLDDRMITESSKNNDAPIWNTKSNEVAWKLYLADDYKSDNVSKYASPSRETDYGSLPPTLTYIGTVDPFLDETLKYVDDLKSAGVEVSFRLFDGCFHGFDLFTFTSPAKEARQFLLDGFNFAVKNYFAEQS